jgi:hypothetical protein
MEIKMRKTVLTILGALLITGSAVQVATAANYHVYNRGHDRSDYRRSYNQVNEPFYAVPQTREGRNMENFGFSGRDPSRVGGEDPSLNPPS